MQNRISYRLLRIVRFVAECIIYFFSLIIGKPLFLSLLLVNKFLDRIRHFINIFNFIHIYGFSIILFLSYLLYFFKFFWRNMDSLSSYHFYHSLKVVSSLIVSGGSSKKFTIVDSESMLWFQKLTALISIRFCRGKINHMQIKSAFLPISNY